MNYITVKEFLEQPKEVQEVFLEWWKENIDDLDLVGYIGTSPFYQKRSPWLVKNVDLYSFPIGKESLPLLTEGQLRDFIYDTTALSLNIRCWYDGWIVQAGCGIEEYDYNEKMRENRIREDLIDAYWLYACEVAKESLQNDKEGSN